MKRLRGHAIAERADPDTSQVPRQGRWHIYGLGLPDEVLEKVYLTNASRLLGLEPAGR